MGITGWTFVGGSLFFAVLASIYVYKRVFGVKAKIADKPQPEILTSPQEAPNQPPPAPAAATHSLELALLKTRESGFFGKVRSLFALNPTLAPDQLEEIEEALYTSDLGPKTVQRLMGAIQKQLNGKERADLTLVSQALRDEMQAIFLKGNGNGTETEKPQCADLISSLSSQTTKPAIWMIVGINGSGKTTTIGKLASQAAGLGLKVLVVAGDTFRAAASEQLKIWSERAQVEIFSPPGVEDPSAVAFDGCKAAQARGFDLVLVDTAGRLHTQKNLMEELKKMQRVIKKVVTDGPHEVLLVLDANQGQNALVQAKQFHEALTLTGVILTKLDGTAKGGVALGVVNELEVPIRLIGVGEKIGDLQPFSPQQFVAAIL